MPTVPGDLYDTADSGAEAFVALSASGQSCEIAAVMRLRDGRPRLAICRGADNPLADITGRVIATESGADNGASSTGYTGMLQTIGLLVDRNRRPFGDGLGRAARTRRWGCSPSRPNTRRRRRRVSRTAPPSTSSALAPASRPPGEAAMLIREAVRIPAAGWDTLNYLHGPMESQDRTTGLIVLGEGREVKIATDVAGFGCPTVLVTSRPGLAAIDTLSVIDVPRAENIVIDAIVKIVAVQRVVGEMQDAAGLTDTTFRYRQTDTKLKPWSPTEV